MSNLNLNTISSLDTKRGIDVNRVMQTVDYVGGLVIDSRDTVIVDGDNRYVLTASTVLPYTTTGAGMPEGGAFVNVGDAVLRQELADPDKGAAMVAFKRDAAEGVPRNVSDKLSETVSVLDFGAVPDGITNNSVAFANALSYLTSLGGGTLYFTRGDYAGFIEVDSPNIRIFCELGTIIRAANTRQTLNITSNAYNIEVWNSTITGQTRADELKDSTTNNTSGLHGIRVSGKGVRLYNVTAYGARQDSLYVRVSGRADLVCEDCYFGSTSRNTVSVVDGSHINFKRCTVFADNSYRSSFGNQLYLFDAEPIPGETYDTLSFEDTTFLCSTTTSGGGHVILSEPHKASKNIKTSFLRCTFKSTTVQDCAIRPRFECEGLSVRGSTFHGRVLVQAGEDTYSIYRSVFEQIELGNASFTYQTTISDGCSLKNISSVAAGGLTTILGATENQVSLTNVQGFSDQTARNQVVSGDLSVVGVSGTISKTMIGAGGSNGGTALHVVKELSILSGTTDAVLLVISGVNTHRIAQVWEVTVNTQSVGSSQSRAQRSQKLAFMITSANARVPVVDMIQGYGWDETVSSPVSGGDRDPLTMGVAVNVVDGDVVVTAKVTNTSSSGSNAINVYAVGTGRQLSPANVE